jgi:catechol 2,3-dioxygenase-like lactoylglutathione lyase family enzyme
VNVLNIRWVGIPTDRYEETVAFFRDTLDLRTLFVETTTIELETSQGDRVQVFAPGDRYHTFFRENSPGPVVLFEVEDVASARRELEAAGIEVVGPTERDDTWEWIHVRAPDGNLYELGSRPSSDRSEGQSLGPV